MLGPEERAGLKALVAELGVARAVRVGLRVQLEAARGEPFGHLPAADSAQERGSRAQAGPAVLLVRALRRSMSDEDALRVTARVVEEGALIFLARTLGRLDRAAVDALSDAEREAWAKAKAGAFPNATVEWRSVTAREVVFEVTACRLVQLVHQVGEPQLAPLFCSADARYFGEVEPGTELVRPTTIAAGHDRCRFTLRADALDPQAR